MSSAGDPITMSWKLNPPMFDGDSLKFRSFRKEATTFADCCGFGDVFKANHEVLMELSRTRRSDHSVSPTLKLTDIARLTSSSDQLSVQN